MTERFTLLAELGRGGMGVVWKARDEETGQIVALKLLHAAFAVDPDYVTRFERELELAKRIHSAHVVEVLGYGARDGAPYLALEYVDGPTLRELLASHGAYSWPEANALLAQITQGLADAHAAGVIHRDLKPSNVLIGPDGVAKLADFGIAKGLDLTGLTGTSTLLGTPAYLAPEGPLDERSDLYSLGIVAFELLSGAAPFTGKTYQEVIVRHIRETPDLAKLPPEARNIVGWLLAKDPAARPQRASALLKVLYGAEVRAVPTVPQPPAAPATVMPQPLVAPSQPFGPSGPSIARPMMPIGQPISYGTAAPVAPVAPIHAQLAGLPPGSDRQRAARTTVAWPARLAAAGRYLGLGPGGFLWSDRRRNLLRSSVGHRQLAVHIFGERTYQRNRHHAFATVSCGRCNGCDHGPHHGWQR
jgi:serine/threonine-protein kinase